jgi:FkbH-like protein
MKLMEALEILRAQRAEGRKPFAVSLVCGFNPLHFETFLNAELCLRRADRKPEIHSGLYGDFWGNLERAQEAAPDVLLILLEWSDLDPRLGIRSLGSWAPSTLPEIVESAHKRTDQLDAAIRSFAGHSIVALCLPTLPLPPVAYTPGWRASAFELESRSQLANLSVRLAQVENVRVLSDQRLAEVSPLGQRLDARSEVITGFPYQLGHASILAELVVRLVGDDAPKKGLITDLDDTLWRGILGEVGSRGVSWDLDHRSHMHGAYQRFLHSLAGAGVLIGVASKNNPAFVEEAFRRKDIVLPAAAIFPMEVHWGPKSESVARILKAWNISADAVVFVDDSPAELAEVQSVYPDLDCIRFPSEEPQDVYRLLERLRDLFGKLTVTGEDAIRLQSLRHSQNSQEGRSISTDSPESFLRQADAELSLDFTKEPLDPRALELINKTNQFNLNGRRYSASEWQRYLADSDRFLLLVNYSDKYGPLGKIAVLAGRYDGKTLFLDTWVMSCRAFGRRIEYRCLEELFERFGAKQIEFDFLATDRNGPLQEFLQRLLGNSPAPRRSLSHETFLERRLETFHRVAELSRG